MEKNKRDSFGTRWGFILACIGSAVGMGNIWMFPTRVSRFGGGSFLIWYFLFVVLVGFTGVIEEMSFGRASRSGPVDAFGKACRSRGFEKLGEAVGMFFQLRDDLMDFQACKQWDGKPAYKDFFQGIYTLPVIHALNHTATGNKMRLFIEETRQGEMKRDVVRERLNGLLFEAGGVRYAGSCMENYKKKAFNLLKQMPGGRGKEEIERLVKTLASRIRY